MLYIISCSCWPSVCLLWGKCLFRLSAHFLIGLLGVLLLSCMRSLYILDVSPLSDKWFGNIVSQSQGAFHFVDDFLFCEEAFQYDVVPLSYLCFRCQSQKIIAKSKVTKFCFYVFFWQFYSSKFCIQFFNTFLIFVYGVKYGSSFILLHVDVLSFPL